MNILHNLVETLGSASFWINALQLILSLSLLVFVHELGHYSFARLFKMRVDKFYLFFNPKFSLVRWDPKNHKLGFFVKNPSDGDEKTDEKAEKTAEMDVKDTMEEVAEKTAETAEETAEKDENEKSTWRDTVYGLGWVPLGGYCSIAGMVDETTTAKELSNKPKSWEFRSRPAWQRLLVMIGGVLFNFLAACFIFAGMTYYYGDKYIPYENATEGMIFSPCAEKIGFRDGDIPLSADGKKLPVGNLQALLEAKQVKVLRDHKDTVIINIPNGYLLEANKEAEAEQKKEHPQRFMDYRVPMVIKSVVNGDGAGKAGLKSGDRLMSVNGVKTPDYRDFIDQLAKNKGTAAMISYQRDGKEDSVKVAIDDAGKIGIGVTNPDEIFEVKYVEYGFFPSLSIGFQKGWGLLVDYITMFKYVFTKEGVKSLGSFGAIGSLFGGEFDWQYFWYLTAYLSIILAFMNILPIPILDGGYVLFLLIEMITGWKPSEKTMDICLRIGFYFIVLLMVFALGNDFYRFIIK